jgi:flagellar protein FliO/FliZ
MTLLRLPCLFLISWSAMVVDASETASKNLPAIPSTGVGLQQSLIGLLIVLAVIVGLAWLTRQLRGRAPGSSQQIKVIAQLAVGAKERISLVELADTWILVGITQTQLNALHVMPKAASTPDTNTSPNQPFAALFDTIRSRNPHA